VNKKILFVSLLIAGCITGHAQTKNYQVIAIGFYNCENFFDPVHDPKKKDEDFTPDGDFHYTREIYKQKLHNIATVIQAMGTDVTPDGPAIIGLAEVENGKVLTDLTAQRELKTRNYKYAWFYTPDERGISTAMLYNPKYFQLLSSEPLHVDLTTVGETRPTRDVLHVYGVLAGDTVHILVNHWPSRSGGKAESVPLRAVAAAVDKRIVDSLFKVNPETKILILGDLNDNPTNASVIKVLKAKADIKDVTLTDIYNPWINIYKKGIGTEAFQGEWSLLDQIMLSGAFISNDNNKWKFYKTEIFKRDFLINTLGRDKGLPHRSFTVNQVWDNGYSDHFPVLVYLVKAI